VLECTPVSSLVSTTGRLWLRTSKLLASDVSVVKAAQIESSNVAVTSHLRYSKQPIMDGVYGRRLESRRVKFWECILGEFVQSTSPVRALTIHRLASSCEFPL
jgi:hypothetical protein